MLLEFELENDGAFARCSSISLLASTLREQEDGRIVEIGDSARTKALTSALILGKNGSGKSTFVRAMQFVAAFVQTSANESRSDKQIEYEPNLLVDGLDCRPIRHHVTFSVQGTVYDFEFAHTAQRITYESMQVADRSVRFRKMYEREWDESVQEYVYSFGEALSGRRAVWMDNTRENALYLSTACQLNSEDLRPAFDWITRYLRTAEISSDGTERFTAKMCLEDEAFRGKVVSFLKSMDINVQDIKVEEDRVDDKFLSSTFSQEFLETINNISGIREVLSNRLKVKFIKEKSDGSLVEFPLDKESTGTVALFNIAGPLFQSLQHGYCLLIDEINTSLHPLVVSFLVDLFADHRINCRRAQLIFTSHDTSVLARRRMRRDQVWVIENGGDGAALIPLSDFSPRRDEALDKGYLGGRYGGIPILTPALLSAEFCEE